jgi:hypothetical protein
MKREQREARQIHKMQNKAEVLGIYAGREIQKQTRILPDARSLVVAVDKAPKNINTMNWVNTIGYAAEDYLYQTDELLYGYVSYEPEESLDASQKRYINDHGRIETLIPRIAKVIFSIEAIVAEPQDRTLNY